MNQLLRRGLFLVMAGAILMTGCQSKNGDQAFEDTEAEGNGSAVGAETVITGKGDSVSVTGTGAAVDQRVVTITAAGTYRLSGEITDGQIAVNAGKEDEVRLILDGFTISNASSSAVYGIKSGSITITTEEGTDNYISDGTQYQYEEEGADEPDAAVFSKDDIILEGSGTLTVTGNYGCGIRSKDDLTVKSGTYVIDAVQDAMKGKDSVEIEGGTFTLNAGEDGIQASNDEEEDKGYVKISDGTFSITAAAKGIKAETLLEVTGGTIDIDSEDDAVHCNGDVNITGGTFTIATGDDGIHADNQVVIDDGTITIIESYEGIEGLTIDINGGVIDVTSEDDGLNAAGGNDGSGNLESGMEGRPGGPGGAFDSTEGAYIKITGGELKVCASGDGIDSNGDFYMEGGTVIVEGPTDNGNGTLDYDGTGTISGGTFMGTGSSGMLQLFSSDSTQNVIVMYFADTKTAGTEWTLTSGDETVMLSGNPDKEYSSLIISSPELKDGETYQLAAGEESMEITVSGIITQSGIRSGMEGGPGSGMEGGPGSGTDDFKNNGPRNRGSGDNVPEKGGESGIIDNPQQGGGMRGNRGADGSGGGEPGEEPRPGTPQSDGEQWEGAEPAQESAQDAES
ncbi:carbohydrate-binding domain-containing protein [Hungatella effluvii]|uniref:carbohydrate-binding domain-containing protein n=1 Tax=Hungatella effluvii TaxID=1096246 RepID=UPI002A80D3E7|nr:carbohydrate-binding domain-containing protein [Hungatella effluvii]